MELKEGGTAGRPEEFFQLARGRASQLHQSAYVLCGDWHLAGDLVRGALARACQHWPRVWRADDADAYIRRVLLTEARERWRHREDLAIDPAAPDAAAGVAGRDGVLRALLGLPFGQRATVVLRYLEGLSQAQTAELLGCSEGTVSRRSSRALAALRESLNSTDAERTPVR